MNEIFARTEILLGRNALARLARKHVLIAGLGGVGSFAAEAVGRSGVGRVTLVDHDVVAPSNLNRQLVALHSTLGMSKAEVMAGRLRDINPDLELRVMETFVTRDNAHAVVARGDFDFVADCIDTVSCKAALVAACLRQEVPVVSSMGAGNRLDVTKIKVTSLNQTHGCGLARALRKTLKEMGVRPRYPVVFSDEVPRQPRPHEALEGSRQGRPRAVNGTISYMPSLFGMMLAGVVVRALLEDGEG